jgi:hypothetical protein
MSAPASQKITSTFAAPFLIGLSLLILACSGEKKSNETTLTKEQYFKQVFLKKFQTLELPSRVPHKPQGDDFQFVEPQGQDSIVGRWGGLCYGLLADTAKFYSLIFYFPAATSIPGILTFDKNGNNISGQSFDFGCWDGGPYDSKCDGFLTIERDLSFVVDHTTTCFDCDSTSNNPVKYFKTSKGRILPSSKIEYEDHQRD